MTEEKKKISDYSYMCQEIYDNKSHRIRNLEKGPAKTCTKCGAWRGHEIECELVTLEGVIVVLRQTREQLVSAKSRADNYYQQLLKISGKLATVKLENNALRKKAAKQKAKNENNHDTDIRVQGAVQRVQGEGPQ